MKATQKQYNKEKFKKDLEFLLFALKSNQHLQNIIVNSAEETIKWYDWLVSDDNTVQEIKENKVLNEDFEKIRGYLEDFIHQLNQKQEVVKEILRRFKEELK